ncbi:MAG TPA: glycosyltransferase family 4 protein [Dermatophilaceae bacterium]|nr:glycosyltransferase family 4 protein [Dermatophilaceae bacterium]
MRIGIVCPYSFDVPGGVQFHVRDLAEHLIGLGHHVSVLAPADDETPLPSYVVSCGRAVPVPYNGSVARVNIGPLTAARVSRWVERGAFDVVHLHEPITPSISVLALWAVEGPLVATFHTSNLRSRAMQTFYPVLRPSLERILARIAVSEEARRTVTTHIGGDAVVIPNGVFVDRFARAPKRLEWVGTAQRPTVAFLGRIDEPRKGLPVLAEALPAVVAAIPGVRVLIAGHGDQHAARARMDPAASQACSFLGGVSDEEKASLLASVDLYVAPHTGGESFGIVLIEAMSARAAVLASDLPAFVQVLDGRRSGETFASGDARALSRALVGLLRQPQRRAALAQAGHQRARRFDWSVVAQDVLAVYETVTAGTLAAADDVSTRWTRLLRGQLGGGS